MKTGRLRDRLTIRTYTASIGTNGENTRSYTTFATVFAEILPVSGKEYLINDRVQGEISHKITIRYLSGLLPKMNGVCGSRTFEFVAILPDRKNADSIIIMANEEK